MEAAGMLAGTAPNKLPVVDRLVGVRDRLLVFEDHMQALHSRLVDGPPPKLPSPDAIPVNHLMAVVDQLEDLAQRLSDWGNQHASFF
jgi:hypothetical protein